MDALKKEAYITHANVTEVKLTIRREWRLHHGGGGKTGLRRSYTGLRREWGLHRVEAEETRALQGSTQEGEGVSTMAAEETRG